MVTILHRDWKARKDALEQLLEHLPWAMDAASGIILRGDSWDEHSPSPLGEQISKDQERLGLPVAVPPDKNVPAVASPDKHATRNRHRTIFIPGYLVGRVIGKNGNTLHRIRAMSKTELRFDPIKTSKTRWIKLTAVRTRHLDYATYEISKIVPWIKDDQGKLIHGKKMAEQNCVQKGINQSKPSRNPPKSAKKSVGERSYSTISEYSFHVDSSDASDDESPARVIPDIDLADL